MHIKKLEICGFKSFVDRTVIHFDHDMIGVVGPNGCGKSNVVDAIRWSMGEQSAKALRGKAMGDVIFSGSETRAQGGFAEVTLTFDNSDPIMAQQLPLEYREYPEIAVTRRLHRGDGGNDYFINKVPVRLRDVTEVFLGTGVGRKAYSIVEQGKIGLIVSARPEDRRVLIEEAAGITKYKARKRQAENKMNLTRTNLTRVGDIVSEIERQLGSLKRQAAKARRYVRYRDEVDDLMLWEASHKLLELIALLGVASASKAQLSETVATERASVDARDAEIEVMRQQTHNAEQAAERAQNLAFASDNDARECETRIDRAQDRYEHLQQRLSQARNEQSDLESKAGELETERSALAQALADVEGNERHEQELVSAEIDKLADLTSEVDDANTQLEGLRRIDAEAAATIARAEAALTGFQLRQDEMQQRHTRLTEEQQRLDGEQLQLSGQGDDLRERVAELVNRKHAMCDARDALGRELPTLRDTLRHEEVGLEDKRAELHRRRSRLDAIKEVAERMEGVGAGVRNLLQTGDDTLGGIIADRIEVPAEYTAALGGLVGDRLQCVVVDDLDRALGLLRSLADDRQGRASIIPRELSLPYQEAQLRQDEARRSSPPFAHDGIIGLVIDQVGFAPTDAGVVRALVGDAVLARTADDARHALSIGLSCDIVTLDGTVFHADGRITGGAGDAFAAGILEQKREMRELAELVARLETEAEHATTHVTDLRQRVTGLQEALDEAKAEAHEAEITMVTGEQDLQRLEQQLTLVSARYQEVTSELSDLTAIIGTTAAEQDETLQSMQEARTNRDRAASVLSEAETHAASSRQRLAAQQAVVTERKVLLAAVSERASGNRQAVERVEREHGELRSRIDTLEQERSEAASESGRVAATIVNGREELMDARHAAREAQMTYESARTGLDDARHTLGLRESELREMRAQLDEANELLQAQVIEHQRLGLEREHLEENVRDRFRGLELATIVGDHHARAPITGIERQRIKELLQLIDRMGSVNVDAMSEYEEQAERYEYFTTQRDDLEKALADLDKAISQMNRESKRLFKYAFDGINRRFKEIFPKMFRGGKAELRLTDPNDMLETGIEILAQPPGKRLGSLELMSGGEKAFTAVSLLLAIFRFKPSPFCILDEVDAPLDDANVGRYVEAIRAMTDRSQFIVITHSKRTMQAVDVLYGVTMQEPGVSKLVGVRVGEGEARSKRKHSSAPPAEDGDQRQQASRGDGISTDAIQAEAAEETAVVA